jgi:hypothetical protein
MVIGRRCAAGPSIVAATSARGIEYYPTIFDCTRKFYSASAVGGAATRL